MHEYLVWGTVEVKGLVYVVDEGRRRSAVSIVFSLVTVSY